MLFSYFEWMRQGEGQQKPHDNSVLLYTKAAILAVFHFQTDKLRLSSIFVLTVHLKPHRRKGASGEGSLWAALISTLCTVICMS